MAKSSVYWDENSKEMAVEIQQELASPANEGRICIVVEGVDDESFYGLLVNQQYVFFYVANSCSFIPGILSILNSKSYNKVIGIKDADFDHLLNKDYKIPNLFITDGHDAEAMMMKEENVDAIFTYYTHKTIENVVGTIRIDLKSLSYLRFYNQKQILDKDEDGLNFDGIKISNIYDGGTPIDMSLCLTTVKTLGNDQKENFPTLDNMMNFMRMNNTNDFINLTQGHDAVACLTIKIQNEMTGNKPGENAIADNLRIRYSFQDFKETQLYAQINEWANDKGYNIWK